MCNLYIVVLIAFSLIKASILPAKTSIECTLTTDKKQYKQGEVPKFEVRIKNTGKKRILLIGYLDGSAVKLKQPYCGFPIQKPVPDSLPPNICKTVNLLTEKDFVLLSPGESFNPFASATENISMFDVKIKAIRSDVDTRLQKDTPPFPVGIASHTQREFFFACFADYDMAAAIRTKTFRVIKTYATGKSPDGNY